MSLLEIIPCVSDHEIVYFEFLTKVTRKTNVPRPMPLFDKADWESLKDDMKALQRKISTLDQSPSVEELWQTIVSSLPE